MTLNALSVDLEEYFQVSNFEKLIDRERWEELPSRVVASTARLLDVFEETANRATFFVLGWVAEQHPPLIREIARRGHEVACHGYDHRLVYQLGPKRFQADLRRARKAIEDALGAPVRGYRAPSYSITQDSLWALPILASEGFEFDSSIFPIRHHRYGIPGFYPQPVCLDLDGDSSILEFPLTTLRVGPLTLPLAGGAYLRFLPLALFRWGLRRLESRGMATVLYTHPWEIDPGQPRQKVSLKVRLNHYHNLDRMEPHLRSLLERFRFAPMGEVLERLEAQGRLEPRPLATLLPAGSPANPTTRRAAAERSPGA